MYLSKRFNIYDVLLGIFIILQFFGLYGGTFQPIRIYAILLFPFIILNKHILIVGSKIRLVIVFTVFTIFYSFVSLFWIRNFEEGFNTNFFLLLNLLTFFEFLFLGYLAKDSYYSIWKGWFFFILLTLPIAYVELIFDKHLSVSFVESQTAIGATGVFKRFASVTFGNYNLYNFILAIAFPILSSIYFTDKYKRGFLLKYLLVFVLFSIFLIVISNGSRGALLSLLLSLTIFFLYYLKKNIQKTITLLKIFTASIIIISGSIYYIVNSDFFFYILFRLQSKGYEDNTRTDLFIAGYEMLRDSYFFGVGGGNFMDNLNATSYRGNPLPPHNVFAEIFSQYGIVVFVLFLSILFIIYNKYYNRTIEIKYILVVSIVTLIINFMIQSSYLLTSYMWVYFGSLYCFSQFNVKNIDENVL